MDINNYFTIIEYGGYITTIKLDYSLYAETKSTSFLGIVQNTALQFFNPRPQQQQHQNPYYEINIDGQNENNDGSNFYRPPVNIPNNFNNDIKIYRQNPSANTPDRFKNNNYFGNQNLNIIQPSMIPTYNQQGQQNNFNNVNYNYNSNQQGTNPQQHGNQNTQYQPFVQQQSQTQPPTLQTTTTPRPTLPAYDINNESLNNICGTPVRAPKPLVFGGAPITHGEWPWIVALYIKNLGNVNYHCGGTIISKKIVITAAHCTNERDRDPYKSTEIVAFFGRQNIVEWSGQDFKSSDIREIHTHPGYRSESLSYDNDISILVMKSTIYYSRFIRPICLWAFSNNIRNIENQVGIVVGWGRDENGKITPEAKRVEAPIVPEAKCLRADESYRYITSNRTFCAGGRKGEGPCNGDSGGGLVLQYGNKWYLRGVVSVTVPDPETKTCNLGNYVVYTDVAQYDSWIGTIMEGHDSN